MITRQAELSSENYTKNNLRDMMANYVPLSLLPGKFNIITDTTDFFRVDYDNVVILEDRPYLIRNNRREGRFGISDQPKFWVKSAIDLLSGDLKIIKLVYHEKFNSKIGDLTFDCFRSPKKEARILDLVKDHPRFMHGFSAHDSAGNIIRIIDNIPGQSLYDCIPSLGENHEDYYYNHFPAVLDDYIELVDAIKFLHTHREKHGDIRKDHIIKDKESGLCRWIDFDFNFMHKESMFGYDLFGLGNILVFLAGRGDITAREIRRNNPSVFKSLAPQDLNIIFQNRVVNLKKIYPYIPDKLNIIFLYFSLEANIFYDNVSQLLDDLCEARGMI